MTLWLVIIPGLRPDWFMEAVVESSSRSLAEAAVMGRLVGELGNFVDWSLPLIIRPLRTGQNAGGDAYWVEGYRQYGCDGVCWF